MFGQTSFGAQPTNTFGTFTSGANTTTASVFGQQPQANTTMPIFGSTTSSFNSPIKQTTFGTSTFGSPSSLQTPLFGSQPNRIAPVTGTAGVFSQSSTITPFMQGQAQGTSVPFNPLPGSDTMMRNGQPQPINTRHQCITCMKDYEGKSLEELRLEDYQLGRKGSAQGGLFSATNSQQPSLFSGLGSTTNTFGQPRTTTFGAASAPTGGLFSSLNQSKPTNLFSTANTGTTFGSTFSFPTTTTQTSLFGQNTTATTATPFSFSQQPQMGLFTAKPLTAPTTTTSTFTGFGSSNLGKPLGIFTSTASPFGSTTNTLGTTSTAAPSLFSQTTQNKPLQFQPFNSNFGTTQPSTQLSFGQPSSSFTFPAPTATTAGLTFGTPSSTFGSFGTGAGAPATGFSSFSAPTSLSLGAPTTTASQFPMFNFSSQQQPSSGVSFFNNPLTSANTSMNTQSAIQSGPAPVPFATTPYKDSPLFYSLILSRNLDEMTKPTNPLAQKAIKEASKRRTSATHTTSTTSPASLGNLTFPVSKSAYNKAASIFDGFEEDGSGASIDILSPKSSVKKLSLKNVQGLNGLMYPGNSSLLNTISSGMESGRVDIDRNRALHGNEEFSFSLADDVGTGVFRPASGESLLAGHLPQDYDNSFQDMESNGPIRNGLVRNRCNIVCSRREYYIHPSFEELDFLTQEDGSCFVENFIVGRNNFGRIRFLQEVNVAGINIDEIVFFRHKETVVYPDDEIKPPVGEGLNVPAEISMERVWPIDKNTREPIKSPVKIKSLNYEEKLRKSCKRMDAEFVSYNHELGTWVFRVKHFSKYSCVPEENEDDDIENVASRTAKGGLGGVSLQEIIASSPPVSSMSLQPPQVASEKVLTLVPTSKEAPRENMYTFPTFLHRKLLLDGTKASSVEKSLHLPIKLTDGGPSPLLSRLIKSKVPVRKYRKRGTAKLERIQQPFSLFWPLLGDRLCAANGPSRGARVCFGRNGHFLRVVNIKNSSTTAYSGTIELRKLEPYSKLQSKGNTDYALAALQKQLELHKGTDSSTEERFAANPLGNVTAHIEIISNLRRITSTRNFSHDLTTNLGQEEQMWELCKILWPPDQVADKFLGQFDPKFGLYQRKQLCEWMALNSDTLFGDLSFCNNTAVAKLLRKGLKLEACDKALSEKNYTLALCLGQNSYEVKGVCDRQMLKWEQNGAEPYISTELRELYQLCASCPLWNEAKLKTMSSTEWLQHFGIYLWYLARPHWTISEVVNSYHRNIVNSLPIQDEDVEDFCFPAETQTEATIANLCICLLKAFSCDGYPMKKLLSPRTYSPDSLDYKISWLLMNNLMHFGFTVDRTLFDTITNSFAGQLENLGYFEWAIFVLKHCRFTQERNMLIRRILERNMTENTGVEKEKFLENIGVPVYDIWNAKAMLALSQGRKFDEIWYLLKSNRFNDAFQVLTTKFRRNYLSPRDTSMICFLLEEMSSISSVIRGWEGFGGTLYNLYIALKVFRPGCDALFYRQNIFPLVNQAVICFGGIDPKDAIDFHIITAMGSLLKFLLQVIADHPPKEINEQNGELKIVPFPSIGKEPKRFTIRVGQYYRKLRFNEFGEQAAAPIS